MLSVCTGAFVSLQTNCHLLNPVGMSDIKEEFLSRGISIALTRVEDFEAHGEGSN